ncbi:ADP-ribosylglycohydrolase family protein [bacterium]|nr:ADP-ribosylglycohydrolase family protein [bacterium]
MLAEQIRDRFLGTVLGLVVGEAVGAPFELRTATYIQMSLGDKPTRMEGGGRWKLAPGEWTDDAAQALRAAESLVTTRGFDGSDLTGGLIDWWRTKPKGLGAHTDEVLARLSRDPEKWETVARDIWYRSSGVAAGNGALCRCLMVGLFFWNDLEKMVQNVIKASQITHFDPRAVESALVLCFVMAQCLHRRFSSNLLDQAIMFAEATRQSPTFKEMALNYSSETLHEFSNFSPFAPYDNEPEVTVNALKSIAKMRISDLRTTGFAVHTMQMALWMLFNSDSYEEGVSRAVRLGGDSDTQGAVVGALMGARHGLAQIPNYWLAPLKDRARIVSDSELLLDRAMQEEERDFQAGRRDPQKEPPRVI